MAFGSAEHEWTPSGIEWSPPTMLPDVLDPWRSPAPAWDHSHLPQTLEHAQTSNDWDNELVKIMHQTTFALQQQQPTRVLAQAVHGFESPDYPNTPHLLSGCEPMPASQASDPSLHRLESLDPLLFPHRLREADVEMLEHTLLQWDTAGAAATVSLPQAGLCPKGQASTVVISEPTDHELGSGPSDGTKADAQVGCSMLASSGQLLGVSDETVTFTSQAFPAPPCDFIKVKDMGSLSPVGLPHSSAMLAHPFVPSLPLPSVCGGAPPHPSVPLQKWAIGDASQNCAAKPSVCLSPHKQPAPRVTKPRRACTQRQSNRVHRAPKWQDMYASADEGSPPSPSSSRSKSSPKKAPSPAAPKRAGRKRLRVDHITLDMLQEQGLFDIPIQAAALELGVGLSVLKRICRQIGLARWPFRTRQSLRGVIAKTQQYLGAEDEEGKQKAEVVQALQQTLDSLQGEAGQGLSDSVRKYRQSVFKLNYKIKKIAQRPRVARPASPPTIPATAAAKMAASALAGPPRGTGRGASPTLVSSQNNLALSDQDCELLDIDFQSVRFE